MDISDTIIIDESQVLNQSKKKKCHGNRRDQRFRRKCRARGMKSTKIEKLLDQKKRTNIKNNRKQGYIRHVTNEHHKATTTVANNISVPPRSDPYKQITTMNTNLNKRKRDASLQELKSSLTIPKSTSSISIVQPLSKKMNCQRTTTTTTMIPVIQENNDINKNYRLVLCFVL